MKKTFFANQKGLTFTQTVFLMAMMSYLLLAAANMTMAMISSIRSTALSKEVLQIYDGMSMILSSKTVCKSAFLDSGGNVIKYLGGGSWTPVESVVWSQLPPADRLFISKSAWVKDLKAWDISLTTVGTSSSSAVLIVETVLSVGVEKFESSNASVLGGGKVSRKGFKIFFDVDAGGNIQGCHGGTMQTVQRQQTPSFKLILADLFLQKAHAAFIEPNYIEGFCKNLFDGQYNPATWPRCQIDHLGIGKVYPTLGSDPGLSIVSRAGIAMTIDGDGSIIWPGTNSISNSGPNFTLKANNSFNLETGGGGVKQIQTTSTSIDLCPDGNTCTAVNLCKNSSGPCYANANDGLIARRHFIIRPFIGLGLPVAEFYAGGHWWQGGLTFHNGTAVDMMGGNIGVQPGTRVINSGGLGASLAIDSTVNIGGAVTAVTVTSTSDARLKDNIKRLEFSLDKILKLEPVSYRLKGRDENQIGFVAQQVEKIFPEVVREDDKGFKSLAYENLVSPVVGALQELHKMFLKKIEVIKSDLKEVVSLYESLQQPLLAVETLLIQEKQANAEEKKRLVELESIVSLLEAKKVSQNH